MFLYVILYIFIGCLITMSLSKILGETDMGIVILWPLFLAIFVPLYLIFFFYWILAKIIKIDFNE